MRTYPELVSKITINCNAWIVGSAADPDNKDPRDYDIWVPVDWWHLACSIIPKDAKINTFGGFKTLSENKEVDIWTSKMDDMFTTNFFKYAYHPRSGIRIKRDL